MTLRPTRSVDGSSDKQVICDELAFPFPPMPVVTMMTHAEIIADAADVVQAVTRDPATDASNDLADTLNRALSALPSAVYCHLRELVIATQRLGLRVIATMPEGAHTSDLLAPIKASLESFVAKPLRPRGSFRDVPFLCIVTAEGLPWCGPAVTNAGAKLHQNQEITNALRALSRDTLVAICEIARSLLEDDGLSGHGNRLADFSMTGDSEAAVFSRQNEMMVELMRSRAFGDAQPSIAGLRTYLRSLRGRTWPTYDEKRLVTKTLNHWKKHFDLEFVYQRQPCVLSVKQTGKTTTGFSLRAKDAARTQLYANARFPRVSLRRADQKAQSPTTTGQLD
jgi:hypothetical protein